MISSSLTPEQVKELVEILMLFRLLKWAGFIVIPICGLTYRLAARGISYLKQMAESLQRLVEDVHELKFKVSSLEKDLGFTQEVVAERRSLHE